MGFTKLDEGIVYSSIMAEDDAVFKVFTILMATCKSNGISPLSPVFISSITKKSLEEVERCIKVLESPDKSSRSTTDDGRRIRKVDGGYFLINYKKYRDFTYSDNPEAVRKRISRSFKDISGHVPTCPDISGHSASASASASASTSASDSESNIANKNIPYIPLAELLRDKIKQSGTDALFKESNLVKWTNEFRLMVEQDHRTIDQIKSKIEAIFKDKFWSKQIRSAGTMREKWGEGKLDRLISTETKKPVFYGAPNGYMDR
jgi:hypothetical protein